MNKIIKIVSSMFLLFASASALAQTAGLMPMAVQQFFDSNGNPLASGTVTTYVVGTTTLKTTWRDAAETITNTNPIVLDAGGKAIIYGDGVYRQVVRDRLGNLIWDAVTAAFGVNSASQLGDGTAVGTILPWSGITAPTHYVFAYGQEISRVTYSVAYAAITLNTNITCASGSPVIGGIADTTAIPPGAPLEATCVAAGTIVLSKTASTVTVSNNASVTVATTGRFFPWGNGNGTTTFNVPDLRGLVLAGRNNMGGTASSYLTQTYFSTNPNSIGAKGGSQSHVLTLGELAAHTHVFTGTALAGHTHDITASSVASMQAGASAVLLPIGTTTTTSTSAGTPAGTNASSGSSTAFPSVQPTITMNYVVKIVADTSISTLNVVTDIQGMTGAITCSGLAVCIGNDISVSVPGAGSGNVIGPATSAVSDIAAFNNTAGTLLKVATALPSSLQNAISRQVGSSVLSNVATLCDGTTDDTTGINAVLASGATQVFIPPLGITCRTSTGLIIPAGVTFQIGAGSTLKKLGATGDKVITVNGANVSILGPGTLDGNGSTVFAANGIFCQNHTNLIIGGGLVFQNFGYENIYIVDCSPFTQQNTIMLGGDSVDGLGSTFYAFTGTTADVVIRDNRCDRLTSIAAGGQTCFDIVGSGTDILRGFIFEGNRCIGVSTGGSLFQACVQNIGADVRAMNIVGNSARWCNYCYTFAPFDDSTITGNTAIDVLTNGFTYEASLCTSSTFTGNTAKGTMNNPGSFVLINVANGCNVIGNTFVNASVDATAATVNFNSAGSPAGSRNIVANNNLFIAGGTGINVANDNSIVTGNVINGGVVAIALNSGAGRVVTNNVLFGQSGTPITSPGTTDQICLNFSDKTIVDQCAMAKVRVIGGTPALTSCGTSPAISGSDLSGDVTMGTGTPTGCVITFSAAYVSAPYCRVTWKATPLASQSYSVSNTAITLTQTATSSNVVSYDCIARAGG